MYRAMLPKLTSHQHWLLTGNFDSSSEGRTREEALTEETENNNDDDDGDRMEKDEEEEEDEEEAWAVAKARSRVPSPAADRPWSESLCASSHQRPGAWASRPRGLLCE